MGELKSKGFSAATWAVIVIVVIIVAGVGGYFYGAQTVPTQVLTTTITTTVGTGVPITETITSTVTKTVTTTYTTSTKEIVKESLLPEVIKIGVMMPLSGPIAGPGGWMLKAAHLAAKTVNDTGGIAGRPIKLVVEDVSADPQMAHEAIRKLVEINGVRVAIGPPTSQQVLTIAPYVNANNVVLISSSAGAAQISELGDDYVFRTVASDLHQTAAIAAAIRYFGYNRVAVMVRNDAVGRGILEGLKKQVSDRLVSEGIVVYDAGKPDYTSELEQIKRSNPDAIFWHGFVADLIVAFKQAMVIGLDQTPALAAQEERDVNFFKDPIAAEFMAKSGMRGVTPVLPIATLAYANFAKAYRENFGADPGLYTAQTYDATMLAINAIARAGVYEGSAIKKALEAVSQNYVGPAGYLALDKNGDIIQVAFEIWRAVKTSEGKYTFEVIGNYDPATNAVILKSS